MSKRVTRYEIENLFDIFGRMLKLDDDKLRLAYSPEARGYIIQMYQDGRWRPKFSSSYRPAKEMYRTLDFAINVLGYQREGE